LKVLTIKFITKTSYLIKNLKGPLTGTGQKSG
jgi:hypothetical protein